jgi:hypothetical protein
LSAQFARACSRKNLTMSAGAPGVTNVSLRGGQRVDHGNLAVVNVVDDRLTQGRDGHGSSDQKGEDLATKHRNLLGNGS